VCSADVELSIYWCCDEFLLPLLLAGGINVAVVLSVINIALYFILLGQNGKHCRRKVAIW
jgi:hypothetical protein